MTPAVPQWVLERINRHSHRGRLHLALYTLFSAEVAEELCRRYGIDAGLEHDDEAVILQQQFGEFFYPFSYGFISSPFGSGIKLLPKYTTPSAVCVAAEALKGQWMKTCDASPPPAAREAGPSVSVPTSTSLSLVVPSSSYISAQLTLGENVSVDRLLSLVAESTYFGTVRAADVAACEAHLALADGEPLADSMQDVYLRFRVTARELLTDVDTKYALKRRLRDASVGGVWLERVAVVSRIRADSFLRR